MTILTTTFPGPKMEGNTDYYFFRLGVPEPGPRPAVGQFCSGKTRGRGPGGGAPREDHTYLPLLERGGAAHSAAWDFPAWEGGPFWPACPLCTDSAPCSLETPKKAMQCPALRFPTSVQRLRLRRFAPPSD
eukprot:gene11257-biopygen7835